MKTITKSSPKSLRATGSHPSLRNISVASKSLLRRFRLGSVVALATFGLPLFAPANPSASATWFVDPETGDWNSNFNWTPNIVPNSSASTATFDVSGIFNVSLSSSVEVNGIVFNLGASPYTITAIPNTTLTVSGIGITNNSGIAQNFVTTVDNSSNIGQIVFSNSATAGTQTVFTNNGGTLGFRTGGITNFNDNSTAGSGMFINNGGTVNSAFGGSTQFNNSSTAASGTFTNNGSTVSGASGGETDFGDSATAGNATLISNGGTGGGLGGAILFTGASTGGTARVEVFGNGYLYISDHDKPGVTIGSLEGSGVVYLGNNNLTVGSNNMSTVFSGAIRDGGLEGVGDLGGILGSLTKIGTGTLALTGTNTYTGPTTVNGGILQFGKEVSLYNNIQASWTTKNITVASGATLAFNVGGTGEFTATDVDKIKALGTATNGFTDGSRLGLDTTNAAGGNFTYGSVIADTNGGANSVGLTKLGTNTLTLTGANTYSGGTIVSGGIVSIGANNNLGTGGVTLNNGAELQFTGSFTFTHPITIAGDPTLDVGTGLTVTVSSVIADGASPGEIVKTSAGTLILTGANTYTGATVVNAGTLQIGDGTSGSLASGTAVTVSSGTTLAFNMASGGSFGGTVANGGTVNFIQAGTNTLSGVISGTGTLNQNGTGTTILSGVNTYTGNTNINNGTLALAGNGSIDNSALIILAATGVLDVSGRTGGGYTFGNTLTGSGTVMGNFTNAGTVNVGSPAASVKAAGTTQLLNGNLTIKGNYTQSASGTLVTAIHSDGSTNVLIVTGNASVNGTLELKPDTGTIPSAKYLIVQAGSVVGQFSTVVQDVIGAQTPLSQNIIGGSLFLVPVGGPLAASQRYWAPIPGMDDCGLKAAFYFDINRAKATGQLATRITQVNTGTDAQVIRFVESFAPCIYSQQRLVQLQQMENLFLTERLNFLRGPVGQGDNTEQGDGSGKAPVPPVVVSQERLHLWTSLRGSILENKTSSDFHGSHNDGIGGIIGLDYQVNDLLTLGGFVGYQGNVDKLAGNAGTLRSEYLTMGLYGTIGHDIGWYGSGLAEVGFGWNRDRRNIILPNQMLTARSDFNSTGWLVRAGGGYMLAKGGWHFGPAAYLEYSGVKQDGFQENGADALNQNISGKTLQSLRSIIGLNANGDIPLGEKKLHTRFGVYWAREYLSRSNNVTSSLAGFGGATFTVNGTRASRNAIIGTTGVSMDIAHNVDLSVDYQYQRDFDAAKGNQHYFGLTLGVKF